MSRPNILENNDGFKVLNFILINDKYRFKDFFSEVKNIFPNLSKANFINHKINPLLNINLIKRTKSIEAKISEYSFNYDTFMNLFTDYYIKNLSNTANNYLSSICKSTPKLKMYIEYSFLNEIEFNYVLMGNKFDDINRFHSTSWNIDEIHKIQKQGNLFLLKYIFEYFSKNNDNISINALFKFMKDITPLNINELLNNETGKELEKQQEEIESTYLELNELTDSKFDVSKSETPLSEKIFLVSDYNKIKNELIKELLEKNKDELKKRLINKLSLNY